MNQDINYYDCYDYCYVAIDYWGNICERSVDIFIKMSLKCRYDIDNVFNDFD
jgi:hypothetical protein